MAVLAMSGGHWFALQTVAWGRMIADFSREDSLRAAVAKTFSGKHPCPMCLKIRKGWHQEKQQEKEPWLKTEKMPEAVWQFRRVNVPCAPTAPRQEQAFVPILHTDYIDSPPTPPPRVFLAAL
jgi:hypothetical protein